MCKLEEEEREGGDEAIGAEHVGTRGEDVCSTWEWYGGRGVGY